MRYCSQNNNLDKLGRSNPRKLPGFFIQPLRMCQENFRPTVIDTDSLEVR